MNIRINVLMLLVAGLIYVSCETKNAVKVDVSEEPNDIYKGLEFEMTPLADPIIPSNKISIAEHGAIGDGVTDNTNAFAEAIKAASEKGGGRVIIPRGIWLTGPITLKSNIELHTEEGAVILFSTDFDKYPIVETSFEGLNTFRCLSPINGRDLENIAITGNGIFDGSGDAWRPVKKSKLTESHWKELVKSGGVLNEKGDIWYPSENSKVGAESSSMNVPEFKTLEEHERVKDFLRPVMVSLISCKNVLLDGPTFQNSPAWCLHPLRCENIILRNLTVRNPWYSQNGDGLDLESCKNALIYRNTFDVGDDGICIKSGKDKDGRDRGVPTENVIVKECIVFHGHGGFTVGSEMSSGVKNIHVSNCTFMGTDVGLRFKSTRGRGGVVENIYISDINMTNIPAEAILFDLYYTGNSPIPEGDEKVSLSDKEKLAALIPAVTEETPSFQNIYIKNVSCKGAGRAVLFQGLPEMNLKNMNLENVFITSTKGMYCIDADGIQMKNVNIVPSDGAAFNAYNSKNISVDNFQFGNTQNPVVRITGELSEKINFTNTVFSSPDAQILVGQSVNKDVVKY